jgi:eukaryotic-like serine/threonine-protein kinase
MTWLSDAAVEHLRDIADWPVPVSDRYDVIEPLARGGMGTVYLARDRELDRDVAMKVLSATALGDEAVERMRQEARTLARLEHPGIVPVYDSGLLQDGRFYYVMKRVQGPRLDQHVAERPLVERLRLFTRICEPVAFAHAHGVVHRDLKPENVMVGPFGEVLVMDWGVGVVGTPGYMPPEQERRERVDGRSDVYALGGILHALVTGTPPDAAPVGEPRISLSSLSLLSSGASRRERREQRTLQAICRMARAADPSGRYPTVVALAADVDRFLAGEPVSASPETAVDRVLRFSRKHRAAIVMVAAYLILRVVIAWLGP